MTTPESYTEWFADWKKRIQAAQIKAAIRVNTGMLGLYWSLGRDIVTKQEVAAWGDGLICRAYWQIVQQVAGQSHGANMRQLAAQFEFIDKEAHRFISFTPWTYTLPDSLKGILPATEELEQELDDTFHAGITNPTT